MRALSIFFLLVLSCFALGQVHGQALPTVKWSTFQGGTMSRIKTFETRVLSTEGSWQIYWNRLTGNPASTAPKGIEWAHEELWVIAAGERQTGGYNIYVRGARYVDARNIHVEYVLTTPQSGGVSTQVITSPYVVLRVERSGGTPQFVRCDDFGYNMGGSTVLLPPYYEDSERPLRWSLMDRGAYSNVGTERIFGLATRREFSSYLNNAFPNNEEMAQLERDVRWDSEMVIAIHGGSENRLTSIEIDRAVVDQNGRVTITWFEDSGRGVNSTRCTPYLLMRIPRYTTMPTVRKVYGRSM